MSLPLEKKRPAGNGRRDHEVELDITSQHLRHPSCERKQKNKPPPVFPDLEPEKFPGKMEKREKREGRGTIFAQRRHSERAKHLQVGNSERGVLFPTHRLAHSRNSKSSGAQPLASLACLVSRFKSSGQHFLPATPHPAPATHPRSPQGRDTSRLILSFITSHLDI